MSWTLAVVVGCGSGIAVSEPTAPTWSGQVRAIMEQHCVACHHTGGAAPFPLVRYDEVGQRAEFIAEVTSRHIMPPWIPGPEGLPLRNHRGLSDTEIGVLQAWAQAGHPAGSEPRPARAAQPTTQVPDLVLRMTRPWVIPAEGDENWGRRNRDKRTFVLPVGNSEPLRVQAISHYGSAPIAVHAVTYLLDDTGTAAWNDARDEETGTYMTGDLRDRPSGEFGGTGVGGRECRLPDGFHWEVPPKADLVMEVQYRPTGRPHTLQESVGLRFSTDEASRPVRTLLSMVRRLDVPIGETVSVSDEYVLPEDVEVIGMTPRAMGVCTSIRMSADVPGEGETILLDLPDFDPHWRMPYMLGTTQYLPAGTVIRCVWRIENTEDNGRNPFLPLDRLSMARRTGAVAAMLHLAAEDEPADERLRQWHREMMRSRSH